MPLTAPTPLPCRGRGAGEPATADTSSPLEWTLLQQLARDEVASPAPNDHRPASAAISTSTTTSTPPASLPQDTPDDARTTAAAEVFGYVAAAPFSGGLLLLFSRRDTTVAQLGQPAQIAFLAAQAQVCAALATVAPARAAIMAKKGGNRHAGRPPLEPPTLAPGVHSVPASLARPSRFPCRCFPGTGASCASFSRRACSAAPSSCSASARRAARKWWRCRRRSGSSCPRRARGSPTMCASSAACRARRRPRWGRSASAPRGRWPAWT